MPDFPWNLLRFKAARDRIRRIQLGFFGLRIEKLSGWTPAGWWFVNGDYTHQYHLVMTNSSPWYRWPMYRWFTYYKWWFSMAMLNNQMVHPRSSQFFLDSWSSPMVAWFNSALSPFLASMAPKFVPRCQASMKKPRRTAVGTRESLKGTNSSSDGFH